MVTVIRSVIAFLTIIPVLSFHPASAADTPAFPGAVGWGAHATGWRGGAVIKVTNLNDSGAGSLRACVEAQGPRVCMFETGGIIEVNTTITATSDLYVAGQSAPSDSGGILLKLAATNASASPIQISDANDVVFRHFTSAPGPGQTSTADVDAVLIQDSSNIIIDHMSLFYSTDELLSTDADERDVVDITLSWNLLAFALDSANHPTGSHSKAMLLCSARTSFLSAGGQCGRHTIAFNAFAHNRDRNFDASTAGLPYEAWNNVMYNAGSEFIEIHDTFATTDLTLINNLGIDGSNTNASLPFIIVFDDLNDRGTGAGEVEGRVYVSGNVDRLIRTAKSQTEAEIVATSTAALTGGRDTILTSPSLDSLSLAGGAVFDTDALPEAVTATVGHTKPARHDLSTNVINQINSESGGSIKDDPSGVGGLNAGYPILAAGTPETDTDGDGMPDTWEESLDGNDFWVTRFNPWGDRDADGWTNLDEYLSFLAGDIPDPRL